MAATDSTASFQPRCDHANRSAVFYPCSGPDTLPCVQIAGAQAYLYVDHGGRLCLSLHLEDVEDWLLENDDRVNLCVQVNGTTLLISSGDPRRG